MAALLTQNGIPPQLIGAFNAAQQEAMTEYARNSPGDEFYLSNFPDPIRPFIDHTRAVVKIFEDWGAVIDESKSHISFFANKLEKGGTTFTEDFNLHADKASAPSELNNENRICIRTLCVSRDPASFIDLTDQADMMGTLDQYRISEGDRVFKADLLSEAADTKSQMITPDSWETIVFDGITPHLPKGASMANRRILMSGWIEMDLPKDWKSRIQNKDVPRFVR